MRLLLAVSVLVLVGCSEVSPNPVPPPAPEAKPAEEPPPPPEPLKPAPKEMASLSFFSSDNADCRTEGPAAKLETIEAQPLKIGMIPTAISRSLANQLTEKTRVWKVDSPGFDFYKILSGGRPGGLRLDRPSFACIRYATAEAASEMIFSVTYNPKTPEVLNIAPARIHYRDFASLSAGTGARQAAIRMTLSLKTYSLERTAGRQAASLQNEEMAVEIVTDPGTGGAIDVRYDPAGGIGAKIALPPWDYSSAYENPRHNLAILGVNVTEIADFDWLQSQLRVLWPSWEYEATDVAKLKLGAEFFSRAHLSE